MGVRASFFLLLSRDCAESRRVFDLEHDSVLVLVLAHRFGSSSLISVMEFMYRRGVSYLVLYLNPFAIMRFFIGFAHVVLRAQL